MKKIKSVPDLFRKEVIAASAASVLFAGLAAFIDAPLGSPADPSALSPENVKAPWIFVGIQQLLKYMPTLLAGVVLPALAVTAAALIPAFGVRRSSFAVAVFVIIVSAAVTITVWGCFS